MVQAVQITMKIPYPMLPEKRMKQSNVLTLRKDDQNCRKKRMIGFLVLKNEIQNEKNMQFICGYERWTKVLYI